MTRHLRSSFPTMVVGFLAASLLTTPAFAANTTVVKDTALRAGPGAFNKKLGVVRKGATVKELSRKGFWVEVKTSDSKGWLTKNVLSSEASNSAPKKKRGLSGMRGAKPLVHVEKSVVVTATKGAFEGKYASKRGANKAILAQLEKSAFSARDYRSFIRSLSTKADKSRAADRFLGGLSKRGDLDIELEAVLGKALAARLASTGLDRSRTLRTYVNLVAARVGEHSPRPDLHYRTFVLSNKKPAAFALPGGYIFITRGLLSLMRSESELAALLGHEIAHIARVHGLKSFKRAAVKAKAENAFAELDAETPQDEADSVATMDDLENLADEMYKAMTGIHSRTMEKEADILGTVYAYHAGYQPLGLATLFERMHTAKKLIFLSKPSRNTTHPPLDKRASDVRAFVSGNGMSGGAEEKGRFKKSAR